MAVADVKTLNGAAAAAQAETQGESQTPEPKVPEDSEQAPAAPGGAVAGASKAHSCEVFVNRLAIVWALTSLVRDTAVNFTAPYILGFLSCYASQIAFDLYQNGVPNPSRSFVVFMTTLDKYQFWLTILVLASSLFGFMFVKTFILSAADFVSGSFISWFTKEIEVRKQAKKAAILAVIERASGVGPPPRDPTPSSSPVESID